MNERLQSIAFVCFLLVISFAIPFIGAMATSGINPYTTSGIILIIAALTLTAYEIER